MHWSATRKRAIYPSFDNNVAERLVKIPVIGRKNFLLVGSEKGGHGAAIMYSLVSSAKANGVEPFAWLKAVFTDLPYHRDGLAFHQASNKEAVTSPELEYLRYQVAGSWAIQSASGN